MAKNNKASITSIYEKYYAHIPKSVFKEIVTSDTVSSNWEQDRMGMYAKWLLWLHKKQKLKTEDLYKVKEYLSVYDRLKKHNNTVEKDIYQFNSLANVYKAIKPYLHKELISNTEKIRTIKKSEAEKLFEDDTFVVIYPKTRSASTLYGKDTQWCTASKHYNSFSDYNSQGKLYIVINKLKNKKYQFHFETDSFMDDSDDYLPLTFLHTISATQGLMDFFAHERPDHLFVLQSVGHGQIYLVRKRNKYGFIKIEYHKYKYDDTEDWENIFTGTFSFNIIVGTEFEKIELSIPSHIAFLKQENQWFTYNFINYKLRPIQEIESRLQPKAVSLQNFISTLFPIGKNDLISFLQNEQATNGLRSNFIPSHIVANKQTALLLKKIFYLDKDKTINPFVYAQEIKNNKTSIYKKIANKDFFQIRYNYNNVAVLVNNCLPYLELKIAYAEHSINN